MSKPKILIQLDSSPHASAFDAVVAIDAGVDQLLRYHGVRPEDVEALVHGAIFTRGPEDLQRTAIFVGGTDVSAAEAILRRVIACFLGPLRVSVLLDPNGANTTAAAAVVAAGRHMPLGEATAVVLGASGPVGQRVVRLLARQGARVRVGSRNHSRAVSVCEAVCACVPPARLEPYQTATPDQTATALAGAHVVIAAGAAGVELVASEAWRHAESLRVAIDLNAVPPPGIAGIEPLDRAADRDGVITYGAIGVGALKMKIHKAAIARLFKRNDQVLDAEAVYAIGCERAP